MDNLIASTSGSSGRLGLKGAAVFVAGFLAVVVMFFAWEILSTGTSSGADAGAPVDVSAIDSKLEGELRKAIDFQGFQTPSTVSDPFVDRAGLAEAASTAGVVQPGASTGNQPGGGAGAGSQPAPELKPPDPVSETRERFAKREAALRSGENVGPLESVFSIEDLVPVGFVAGGSSGERVIFFSRGLCQTFPFPLGTRFFDGWLRVRMGSSVQFIKDDAKRSEKRARISATRPLCEAKKPEEKSDSAKAAKGND